MNRTEVADQVSDLFSHDSCFERCCASFNCCVGQAWDQGVWHGTCKRDMCRLPSNKTQPLSPT